MPHAVGDVFAFFARPEHLAQLMPPQAAFELLSGPEELGPDAVFEYRLRVRGVTVRWKSRIVLWEPGICWVEEQERGPYTQWRHEHTFEDPSGGTVVRDAVSYAHIGGALLHRLVVQPDLERLFGYRRRKLVELFPAEDENQPPRPTTVRDGVEIRMAGAR